MHQPEKGRGRKAVKKPRSIDGAVSPTADEVLAQLERIHAWPRFRGKKLQRLLDFIIGAWIDGRSKKLTARYIANCLRAERRTYEEDYLRWGYPKTRANLCQVRSRLQEYFETAGYADPIIFSLPRGSYAPVVMKNPVSATVANLDLAIDALVGLVKAAVTVPSLQRSWHAFLAAVSLPRKKSRREHRSSITRSF